MCKALTGLISNPLGVFVACNSRITIELQLIFTADGNVASLRFHKKQNYIRFIDNNMAKINHIRCYLELLVNKKPKYLVLIVSNFTM